MKDRPIRFQFPRMYNSSRSQRLERSSATSVNFDEDSFWVSLADGRVLGVPLAWFPRLLSATPEQLQQVRISPRGLHWESLNEDISIEGLLRGLGDQSQNSTFAA